MVRERVWCGRVVRRGVVGCVARWGVMRGCGGVRGAVGYVAREGERWDVRAGAWRGVWLGACGGGEKFEGG